MTAAAALCVHNKENGWRLDLTNLQQTMAQEFAFWQRQTQTQQTIQA